MSLFQLLENKQINTAKMGLGTRYHQNSSLTQIARIDQSED